MKRFIIGIILAAGLSIFLCACPTVGGGETPETGLTLSPYQDAEADGQVRAETVSTRYENDIPSIYCALSNDGDSDIYFGDPRLEVNLDGQWLRLPYRQVTAAGEPRSLAKGQDTGLCIDMGAFNYDFPDGSYRVTLPYAPLSEYAGSGVLGRCCFGAFTIGDGGYSKARPFGYAALQDLPEDYGYDETREQVIADGVVYDDWQTAWNSDRAASFFYHVNIGIPDMVRLLHYTEEGDPIITDYGFYTDICGSRVFTVAEDDSRDAFAQFGEIITEYWPRLILNEEGKLCFCNWTNIDGAGYDCDLPDMPYREDYHLGKLAGSLKSAFADNGGDIEGGFVSPDGKAMVTLCLSDAPLKFGVQANFDGQSSWTEVSKPGDVTALVHVAWQDAATAIIVGKTADGTYQAMRYNYQTREMGPWEPLALATRAEAEAAAMAALSGDGAFGQASASRLQRVYNSLTVIAPSGTTRDIQYKMVYYVSMLREDYGRRFTRAYVDCFTGEYLGKSVYDMYP